MKLCAIYNVWGDYDLLYHSMNNIYHLVDGVIIVYSVSSNYGEKIGGIPIISDGKITAVCREPQFRHPMNSETDKRNFGLNVARGLGFTHFVSMDADEFYDKDEFLKAKQRFNDEPDLEGIVCQVQCYFKSPKLTIGIETTRVPFIHKLTPTIKHEFNRNYPFAWEGKQIRIDPTRSLNINNGVKFSNKLTMHHYSWIRQDYEKKIRNSTARANIEKSTIRQDLQLAKDGYFCNFYGKKLYTVENKFNLPEYDVVV